MRFHIKHTTRYAYTGPVFCEPMTLRLRPRGDAMQRVVRHRLSIDPEPAGIAEILETDGHVAARAWFGGLTSSLAITASSVVETLCENPFDYLLEPAAQRLGFSYEGLGELLNVYRRPRCTDDAVVALSRDVAERSGGDTLAFLFELCQWMQSSIEKVVRPEGAAHDAAETLRGRRGACRDLAVLFMEVCRHAGLAARFTSGHQAGDADTSEWHLHAWAEVYLPGAGWRGYDPTRGLAVSDGHVALAAAADPVGAAATVGSFRSAGVRSSMQVQLVVRCDPGGGQSAAHTQLNAGPLGETRQLQSQG